MSKDQIALQNAEFDTLTDLCNKWKTLRTVAVVDDDYPKHRHIYEGALKRFLRAVVANRGVLK